MVYNKSNTQSAGVHGFAKSYNAVMHPWSPKLRMTSYGSVNTCDKCKCKILKTMAKYSLVDEYDDVSHGPSAKRSMYGEYGG